MNDSHDESNELKDATTLSRRQRILLLIVLIVASAIRLYGVNHDLPFIYDQDESMFVGHAVTMLKDRDPNPHWFGPPAGPTMYLLAATYGAIFVIGRVFGVFSGAEDFKNLFYANPTAFYLSGRIISLIFGVASIWMVYKIGRRLFGYTAGLLAASVLALSPIHIAFSQQVRMDTQMTFLLLVAFWYCLKILETQDWKSYILSGFMTGLATVTKYPAAVFTATIAFAHFLRNPSLRPRAHVKLAGAAIATIAGAFIGAPFVFLDFRSMLRDVAQEARPEHLGATGEGLVRNFIWYIREPLPSAISIVGLLLALFGVVVCISSKQRARWLLVSFPLTFLIFISSLNLRWERWILPLVPFLCLLLALGAIQLIKYFTSLTSTRVATAIAVVILAFVIGPLGYRASIQAHDTASPSTSTVARQWIVENLPSGTGVLTEVYGPPLPSGYFQVFTIDKEGNVISAERIKGDAYPQWDIARLKDPMELAKQRIEYVVISDRERYLLESNKYAKENAAYQQAIGNGRLVFEINQSAGVRRGPRIQIFDLKP